MTITMSKKLELREAGRCPECFRYLGKNEKALTVDWCNNCHVSYPNNLRVAVHQMTDQQITKIAQRINGSVSAFELRDRLGWICGLTDNDMVSEAGMTVSRIAQMVWDARQAN